MRILCLPTAEWIVDRKKARRMFSDSAWIQLIRSIFSLNRGVNALHMTLVMMPVSGRGLVVSVSVFICIFALSFSQNLVSICFTVSHV